MNVKCRFCEYFDDDSFCRAKKSGGKITKRRGNKYRKCSRFKADPEKMAAEADKIWEKSKIPTYRPTWRSYLSDQELKEKGELGGPKMILINPERK